VIGPARHRYVLSGIWELPFKGNRFVEGWQLSLITQGQTGNPITIVTNIVNFTGNANLRPDLIGSLDVVGHPEQWFTNTVCDPRVAGSCTADSVFALPVSAAGAFHMGNLPRNALTGPGFFNTDLSIIKKTKVGGATVELRAEAFNLFNHPNFGAPEQPHRDRGEHELRRADQYAAAHRRLGLLAPVPVRDEGPLLNV
jgi:hypothetical protein